MDCPDCCKEKLSQNLLPRQTKAYVDQNLQLQIPEDASPNGQITRYHSPIYTHYMGNSPPVSYLESQVNENELYQVMKDAEHSYDAWQKMREQILQASKVFQ